MLMDEESFDSFNQSQDPISTKEEERNASNWTANVNLEIMTDQNFVQNFVPPHQMQLQLKKVNCQIKNSKDTYEPEVIRNSEEEHHLQSQQQLNQQQNLQVNIIQVHNHNNYNDNSSDNSDEQPDSEGTRSSNQQMKNILRQQGFID
ncbi:unnamed protein product [Paramecium octaurelia]|uniref:Uncharacterized protein n=1 Tax=Paramecium octaurelia TaxID=43137 RepID=A0A8S1X5F7_PAROT|nr:unnamed protein product [Paramecium octaurelia]